MATRKPSAHKPAEILLVEDNPGDVRLLQEAFRGTIDPASLHVVRDGEQALKFLRQEPPYQTAPRPTLVLLDLNLPRMGGCEVLAYVKQDRRLRQIPIMVLSTSTASGDIQCAYDLHANCYIEKPVDLDRLVQIGKLIEAFWVETVVQPA